MVLPEEEDLETMSDLLAAETPAFALTPVQTNTGNAIDRTTSTGVKARNATTTELVHEFDGESKNVHAFCEKLNDRAIYSGWCATGGGMINMPDSNGIDRNLVAEFGVLTFENIKDHAVACMSTKVR